MPTDDYYTVPAVWPTQPATNSQHAYPLIPGFTAVRHYHNGAAVEKGRQFEGVTWTDPATGIVVADFETLNGGVYNDYLRWIYTIYRRLRRFLVLVVGVTGALPGYDVPGDGGPTNFTDIKTFAATGFGTQVRVFWPEGGGTDLRSMTRAGASNVSGVSGMYATDEVGAYHSGISEVTDVEFLGYDLPTALHSARLTLNPNKPLNPNLRGGFIYLTIQNYLKGFPTPLLHIPEAEKKDPRQCLFVRKQFTKALLSFKTAYPSAPMSGAISTDGWACTKMNELNQVELDGFTSRCNFTPCRFYAEHSTTIPTPADIYGFLISKGQYRRRVAPGGGADKFRAGRLGWEGLWLLHGLPLVPTIQEQIENLFEATGHGVLLYDTGTADSDGYRIYSDWQTLATAAGSDAVGLLAAADPGVVKEAPDGGEAPNGGADPIDRAIPDKPWYPARALSNAMGIRRGGVQTMGTTTNSTGEGENDVQRVMRKEAYVSPGFSTPVNSDSTSYSAEQESKIQTYSTLQDYPGESFQFNMTFQVPKQGDAVGNRRAGNFKTVTGTVASAYLDANGDLALRFLLGVESSVYPFGVSVWDCGGNVVSGEAADTITNTRTARTSNTDPQKLFYPGDVLFIVEGGIRSVGAMVVAATAFNGPAQAGARLPNVAADGIPQVVKDKHELQDLVVVSTKGHSGKLWLDFFNAGGFGGGDIVIDNLGHVGTAPTTDYYQVKIEKVTGGTVESLLGSDWRWDFVTGTFYIDATGWDVSSDQRLAATVWVYDTRRTLPINNVLAMENLLEGFSEGYISAHAISSINVELSESFTSPTMGERRSVSHWSTWTRIVDGIPRTKVTYEIPWDLFEAIKFTEVDPGFVFPPEWPRQSQPEILLKPYPGGDYIIGAWWDSAGQDDLFIQNDELPYAMTYVLRCPVSVIAPSSNSWGANDIKRVTLNFEILNPILNTFSGVWVYGESPVVSTVETPITDLSVSMIMLEPDGDDYNITWLGNANVISVSVKTVGPDLFVRGTIEITSLYKQAIVNLYTGSKTRLGIIPGGPFSEFFNEGLNAHTDFRKSLESWISTWNATFHGPVLPDPDTNGLFGNRWSTSNIIYSWMSLDSFICSGLKIQFDEAQLIDGAHWYADHEKEAQPPDLLALPVP